MPTEIYTTASGNHCFIVDEDYEVVSERMQGGGLAIFTAYYGKKNPVMIRVDKIVAVTERDVVA